MRTIFLLTLIFLFQSCASDSGGVYVKSSKVTNQLKSEIVAPWVSMNPGESDYALQNKKTKSLFLFNSACRKYESSTLNTLTSSMLSGIADLLITEKKNVFYQEREAVEVAASGKLDGVQRFFRIITTQKNNCIYDYILISTSQKNLETDTPALRRFLQRIILN